MCKSCLLAQSLLVLHIIMFIYVSIIHEHKIGGTNADWRRVLTHCATLVPFIGRPKDQATAACPLHDLFFSGWILSLLFHFEHSTFPAKLVSLCPHFHLNFKKNPFPPSDSGSSPLWVALDLSSARSFFRQLTNDPDSLVNSGAPRTHNHTRSRHNPKRCAFMTPPPSPPQMKDPRWPLCCLGRGQIARMSVWAPHLWPLRWISDR